MKKYLPLALLCLLFVAMIALPISLQRRNLTSVDQSFAEGETKKELSKTGPPFISGSSFEDIKSPPEYLGLGSDYWVRLSISGKNIASTSVYKGSDIMLVLDVTGSMRAPFPIGPSSPGVDTSRMQAAKQALRSFVADANYDPANPQYNDYLGFGTFVACSPASQTYAAESNKIPLSWSYEGNAPNGNRFGYGYTHVEVKSADPAQKGKINSLLSDTGTTGVLRLNNSGQIIFCPDPSNTGNQTDLGGGLITGLSQLTNLVQNQRRTFSSDQTLYKNSLAGTFTSPTFRNDKKKYLVIATDGEQNFPPLAYDAQPIITQLNLTNINNAVKYAASKNVAIYTISIGQDGSTYADLLKQISADTGGKYFPGANRDELIQSYSKIYDEVEDESTETTMTVLENINTDNFKILDLNPATNAYAGKFYVSRVEGSTETNVTNDVCTGGSCIKKNSDSSYAFQLPSIPPDKKYYIYFKVQTTNTSVSPIPIDGAGSKVIYAPGNEAEITNKSVAIDSPNPFFQTSQGDLYSLGDITDNLRANEFLMYLESSLVLHKNGLDTGTGDANPLKRKARYEVTETENYKYFEDLLQNKIENKSIGNRAFTAADLTPADTNVDKYIVKLTGSSSGIYEFQGTTNFNDDITRIVFIDGNLLISKGTYSISANGKNSLVFVVSGNVGIDPSVEKIEGIFISNGYFDSVCVKSNGFGGDECGPSIADGKLQIEGSVVSFNGGIRFQRKGIPIGTIDERKPGEQVIYRPDITLAATNVLGKVQRTWKERAD